MRDYKFKIFTSAIEKQISDGIFKTGDKLPSIRTIKEIYHLSTSSVQSGYDDLIIKGKVKSIPRYGYIVHKTARQVTDENRSILPPIPRDPVFRENVGLISEPEDTVFAPLNVAAPSDLFIPQKLVLRTMQTVIREKGAALLRYYPLNGSAILRQLLSRRAASHGSIIQPDELLITDGALQSLYIALAAITNPGDIIAIESPCVFSILEVIGRLGLRTIEIPVSFTGGLDTDCLRGVCSVNKIKAVIVTPNFHNPTGILMSDESKKELLDITSSQDIPIIENEIYGDLYFQNTRPSTLRNFENNGLVITCSSFSKSLAPGIRLGWIAAGRFFSEIERVKFALGRSTTPLYQEVMVKLLSSSAYDRHLKSFRRQLAQLSTQVVSQFTQYFPEDAYFHPPDGGCNIWARLPDQTDMASFYAACERYHIRFTPGSTFSFTKAYQHNFRIVFSQRMTQKHFNAIQLISQLLKR